MNECLAVRRCFVSELIMTFGTNTVNEKEKKLHKLSLIPNET